MIYIDFVLQFSVAWTQTWQEEKWRYMETQDIRYFKLNNIFILFKFEDTISKFFPLHVSYPTQF